jgi:flagellar biosynthesis chaperone FliJ
MDHQHRGVAEKQWQYTPSFAERYAQIISEMRSQIRSLENAIAQLQRDRYANSNKSPALWE